MVNLTCIWWMLYLEIFKRSFFLTSCVSVIPVLYFSSVIFPLIKFTNLMNSCQLSDCSLHRSGNTALLLKEMYPRVFRNRDGALEAAVKWIGRGVQAVQHLFCHTTDSICYARQYFHTVLSIPFLNVLYHSNQHIVFIISDLILKRWHINI